MYLYLSDILSRKKEKKQTNKNPASPPPHAVWGTDGNVHPKGEALTCADRHPKSQELRATEADFSFTRPVRGRGLCPWKPLGLRGAGAPSSVALTATAPMTMTDLRRASLWRVRALARQWRRAPPRSSPAGRSQQAPPEIKGPGCALGERHSPENSRPESPRKTEKRTMASDAASGPEAVPAARPRACALSLGQLRSGQWVGPRQSTPRQSTPGPHALS